jgi:hypothetical protein
MRNMLTGIGLQEMLYEDFEEEMLELLRKTRDALPAGTADQLLLSTFNDEAVAMSIITYIKVRMDHPDWPDATLGIASLIIVAIALD